MTRPPVRHLCPALPPPRAPLAHRDTHNRFLDQELVGALDNYFDKYAACEAANGAAQCPVASLDFAGVLAGAAALPTMTDALRMNLLYTMTAMSLNPRLFNESGAARTIATLARLVNDSSVDPFGFLNASVQITSNLLALAQTGPPVIQDLQPGTVFDEPVLMQVPALLEIGVRKCLQFTGAVDGEVYCVESPKIEQCFVSVPLGAATNLSVPKFSATLPPDWALSASIDYQPLTGTETVALTVYSAEVWPLSPPVAPATLPRPSAQSPSSPPQPNPPQVPSPPLLSTWCLTPPPQAGRY